jgi:hypothetical protein
MADKPDGKRWGDCPTMKVHELIALLSEFPGELPVFFTPDDEGRCAVAPKDAALNLVHPERGQVIDDGESSVDSLEGFVDSLVIYPRIVREEDLTD